ncbi:hypothetical protein LCGC14_0972050 [marine sediment metagenome]|uniref:YopX protein domain-containing protein n=2 Tax=marine sediment metagenome TaxID=412755 RepID=A0A0F9NBG6_9ZZZZ
MREIKFRVWDKRKGRMRFGNDNLLISLGGLLFWDVGYKEPDMLGEEERQDYVLMQYTGLKDKNGVEIYEGDVVALWTQLSTGPHKSLSDVRVAWSESGLNWNIWAPQERESWEVISNIYENPELLN